MKIDSSNSLVEPLEQENVAEALTLSEIRNVDIPLDVLPTQPLQLLYEGQFDFGVFGRCVGHRQTERLGRNLFHREDFALNVRSEALNVGEEAIARAVHYLLSLRILAD